VTSPDPRPTIEAPDKVPYLWLDGLRLPSHRPALHSAIVGTKIAAYLAWPWALGTRALEQQMTIRFLATLFRDTGVRKLSNQPC
jgi:hypothetical protein